MEIITINLAAGETKQFRKAGSYIEILSSVGAIGVNLYTSQGGQTDSIKGGLSGLYMRSDFGAFDVQEQSGAAQSVQLLVCDAGEDGGSRRQPGNVRVIDQSADLTTSKTQYIAMNALAGGASFGVVAGIYAQTKQISLQTFKYGGAFTGSLALLWGTGRPTNTPSTAPLPANKMIGAPAASSALSVGGNLSAAFPLLPADVPGVQTIGYVGIQANQVYQLDLKTPILIPPGYFFGIASGASGQPINFSCELSE